MNCDRDCKICPNIVISTAVTIVTVDGVDTLVMSLPEGNYANRCKYCIIVAQTIPEAATINMPVAFSNGGGTDVVFPLLNRNCVQVTASGVRSRTKYPVIVFTNTTGGVFSSCRNLQCYPAENLASLPLSTNVAGG